MRAPVDDSLRLPNRALYRPRIRDNYLRSDTDVDLDVV